MRQTDLTFLWDLGPVLAVVLLAFLLPRLKQRGAFALTAFVLATGLWILGEVLDLDVPYFETKLLCIRIRYIGVTILPVAWFCFACQYSRRDHWVRLRNVVLLCVVPAVTLIVVWTTRGDSILYRRLWVEMVWGFPVLKAEFGFWYWVQTGYAYALLLAGAAMFYDAPRRLGKHYRRQARMALYAFFFPFAVNVLFQLGIGPAAKRDLTPFMLIITCALFTWSFLRHGLLNPPVRFARDVVVQSMKDGVIVVDLDWVILDLNPAALSMLGGHGEFVGRPLRDCLSLPQLPEGDKGGLWAWETRRPEPDGKTMYLHVRVSPVHQKLVGHAGYVVVLQNVTEKMRMENALRQAQKMETVGQLAGGVAHDFNNVLQAISGYTDMAMRDLGSDHRAYPFLQEAFKAGDRAARLVSQLLAFSRRQLIRPERLDLNEVVTGLLKMLGRVLGEHIHICFVSGVSLGIVQADRGQLEQVLMNLTVNARDAMPEGGTLTIETFRMDIDEEYCERHEWAQRGPYAGFSVADTGCGMDAETQARMFDPFFTTKEVGKGTGLGLATVYGIVKQHGGMITAYSELGKGSLFKVYLPRLDAGELGRIPEKSEEPCGGSETILLAEDDAMVRDLTHRVLETAGYTVLDAQDGEDALRAAKEYGGTISLALLDVVMPRLGGRVVYEQLKQQYPTMRFLFASGYSAAALHHNFVLENDVELIQKPFDRKVLLSKVRQVLDGG